MTHSQAMGVYVSGLAICSAAGLFLISQVDNPLLDFNEPPEIVWRQPPIALSTPEPQVTGPQAPSDPLSPPSLDPPVTPTPDLVAQQEPSESATGSTVRPPADVPTTTTPPRPQRPAETTTAPRPPAPPPTTVPPVVIKPPILPPVKVPLQPLCNGLNVLPQVSRGCNDILGNVVGVLTGVSAVGGRGARPDNPTSCHPQGLALDLIVRNKLTGNLIVAYVKLNKTRLGITTILWQVPDHFDHVHLSFAPCTK